MNLNNNIVLGVVYKLHPYVKGIFEDQFAMFQKRYLRFIWFYITILFLSCQNKNSDNDSSRKGSSNASTKDIDVLFSDQKLVAPKGKSIQQFEVVYGEYKSQGRLKYKNSDYVATITNVPINEKASLKFVFKYNDESLVWSSQSDVEITSNLNEIRIEDCNIHDTWTGEKNVGNCRWNIK